VPVIAAERDDRSDRALADELVEERHLALGQDAVQAWSSIVGPLPVRRGPAERQPLPQQRERTHARQRAYQVLDRAARPSALSPSTVRVRRHQARSGQLEPQSGQRVQVGEERVAHRGVVVLAGVGRDDLRPSFLDASITGLIFM
jgi:endonuclease/exonuclease/phosphatase (EEP) superfamily protein YafD